MRGDRVRAPLFFPKLKNYKCELDFEAYESKLLETNIGNNVIMETERSNQGFVVTQGDTLEEEERLSLLVSELKVERDIESDLPRIRRYYIGHLKRNQNLIINFERSENKAQTLGLSLNARLAAINRKLEISKQKEAKSEDIVSLHSSTKPVGAYVTTRMPMAD